MDGMRDTVVTGSNSFERTSLPVAELPLSQAQIEAEMAHPRWWQEYSGYKGAEFNAKTGRMERSAAERVLSNQMLLLNGELIYQPTVYGIDVEQLDQRRPIYHKGLYEESPIDVPFPLIGEAAERKVHVSSAAHLPDMMAYGIELNGPVRALENTLRRTFDRRHRIYSAQVTYEDDDRHRVEAHIMQFADYARTNRTVTQVTLRPCGDTPLHIRGGIDSANRPKQELFKQVTRGRAEGDISTYTATTVSDQQIAIAQRATLTADGRPVPGDHTQDTQSTWRRFDVDAKAGEMYTLTLVSATYIRERREPYKPFLLDEAIASIDTSPDLTGIIAGHIAAWETEWQKSAFTLTGDLESLDAMTSAKSALLGQAGKDGLYPMIGAKIGDIEGYGARAFWDDFLFTIEGLPREQQRAMLCYIIQTLEMARVKAEQLGKPGANPIWEFAQLLAIDPDLTADERMKLKVDACPPEVPTPTGDMGKVHTYDKAIHIGGDVAYAIQKYAIEMADPALLWRDGGAVMIVECARFLAACVEKADDGRMVVRDVVGPDEWHERVDDEAFTVLMILNALDTVATLRGTSTAEFQRFEVLCAGIGLSGDEWRHMEEVRARLSVAFDPASLVIDDFHGWREMRPLEDFYGEHPEARGERELDQWMRIKARADYDKRLQEAELANDGRTVEPPKTSNRELIHTVAVKKQDSVVLALELGLWNVIERRLSPEMRTELEHRYGGREQLRLAVLQANIDEYLPATLGGSSLSAGLQAAAMVHAYPKRAGARYMSGQEDALVGDEFASEPPEERAASVDYGPANRYGTEKGIHGAGSGNLLRLYDARLGLRVDEGILHIDPHLPAQCHTYACEKEYFGQAISLAIDNTAGSVTVTLKEPRPGMVFPLQIYGVRCELTADQPVAFYQYGAISGLQNALEAEDLKELARSSSLGVFALYGASA